MLTPEYREYFGFTQQETQALISTHAIDLAESEVISRIDMAAQWYSGYIIGNTLLFNPCL